MDYHLPHGGREKMMTGDFFYRETLGEKMNYRKEERNYKT